MESADINVTVALLERAKEGMCEAVIRNRLRRNLINIVKYYGERVPAATRSNTRAMGTGL